MISYRLVKTVPNYPDNMPARTSQPNRNRAFFRIFPCVTFRNVLTAIWQFHHRVIQMYFGRVDFGISHPDGIGTPQGRFLHG